MIYEVKDGDTLSAIAERFYGDAERKNEIVEANDSVTEVTPGQKITVPLLRFREPVADASAKDWSAYARMVREEYDNLCSVTVALTQQIDAGGFTDALGHEAMALKSQIDAKTLLRL